MQANSLSPIRILLLHGYLPREHIVGIGSCPSELELDLLPQLLLCVLQRPVILRGGPVVGNAEVQFLEGAFALERVLHFINKNYNNYMWISRR